MYESKLAQSLVPYVAGEQPRNMKKLIKLNTNENPYPPSPDCAKALQRLDLAREGGLVRTLAGEIDFDRIHFFNSFLNIIFYYNGNFTEIQVLSCRIFGSVLQ